MMHLVEGLKMYDASCRRIEDDHDASCRRIEDVSVCVGNFRENDVSGVDVNMGCPKPFSVHVCG